MNAASFEAVHVSTYVEGPMGNFMLIAVVRQRLLYGVSRLKIPLIRLRTGLISIRKTWLWIIAAASGRPEIAHTLVASARIAR